MGGERAGGGRRDFMVVELLSRCNKMDASNNNNCY